MVTTSRLIGKVVLGVSFAALVTEPQVARAQTPLPNITITEPNGTPRRTVQPKKPRRAATATRRTRSTQRAVTAPVAPTPIEPQPGETQGAYAQPGIANPSPAAAEERRFSAARERIFTKIGANQTELGRQTIDALPLGDNQQFDKLLLQLPGVTQDTAGSGNFHVRNEHANVQFRINGVFLPDGISGFGQFLETSFVGRVALVDGALPAQFGLRTAGVLDIQTRNGAFEPGGTIGIYGGSRQRATTFVDYGNHVGTWDYYVAGRFLTDTLGIENPTPRLTAIHDRTFQGKFFGYASGMIDPDTRLTYITGTSVDHFQIPTTPGLAPSFTAFGQTDFDSARINERQLEQNVFNVIALQRSVGEIDAQLSVYNRYSTVHFNPDPLGDLLFNGVASNVFRSSVQTGVLGDAAYRYDDRNTFRFGFSASGEQTHTGNKSTVLPLDGDGNPFDAPFNVTDPTRKTGFLVGAYLQDEYKITNQLTLNAGVRFDQMYQYVDAHQLSPRVALEYRPFEGTTFHAGYARYFTPPQQALAAPTNLGVLAGTTLEPAVGLSDPVKPERANVVDVGIDQVVFPGLLVGVDFYYKQAKDLLDDGQFGQALVLNTFNYQNAYNEGVEVKAKYINGNFLAFGNLAIGRQRGERIISNQFLFDPDELAYISNHHVYTDHSQKVTASGGIAYNFYGTRFSADVIYASGLRSGFANTTHVPEYVQVNMGIAREFQLAGLKSTTIRFDVINVLDEVYQIRDGSGIGVFAPQYGQRRAFLAGISQKF